MKIDIIGCEQLWNYHISSCAVDIFEHFERQRSFFIKTFIIFKCHSESCPCLYDRHCFSHYVDSWSIVINEVGVAKNVAVRCHSARNAENIWNTGILNRLILDLEFAPTNHSIIPLQRGGNWMPWPIERRSSIPRRAFKAARASLERFIFRVVWRQFGRPRATNSQAMCLLAARRRITMALKINRPSECLSVCLSG